ncbi:unnamed protein product [Strongylus vulgaris]|uniref:Uncharacterized protein n=1 Tax=Strongylus vulgaris TaxID=40348 RepID=A0A3P7I062_STRVU|nr:unnamed protein product [Strongylus vulgaris]
MIAIGENQTLSLARHKYWIPRAPGSLKYYLKNCATPSGEAESVMSYSANNGIIRGVIQPANESLDGRSWERLVGSVKRFLRKLVGREKLNFASFLLTAIEAVKHTSAYKAGFHRIVGNSTSAK